MANGGNIMQPIITFFGQEGENRRLESRNRGLLVKVVLARSHEGDIFVTIISISL